jgi:pyruvate formate lyase activating enzyme
MKGYIHSIESFGSSDGPGIRFIVFMRGCAMRCRYCHNADTWVMRASDYPAGITLAGGERITVPNPDCSFPENLLHDDIRESDDILDQAERYRNYWGERGGITVSGGEPMLQMDFVTDLFRKAHDRGINTCLDTSGQPFRETDEMIERTDKLLEDTDLVMLDIKHINPEKHMFLTGQPNDNILSFARHLDTINKRVWIRHVLVPGITDNDADLMRLRQFLDTLSNIERIDVLPYHTMGIYKWKSLGMPYSLKDTSPPSADRVERAKEILGVSRFI